MIAFHREITLASAGAHLRRSFKGDVGAPRMVISIPMQFLYLLEIDVTSVDGCTGNGIRIRPEPEGSCGLVEEHMAHTPPTALDVRSAKELPPAWVEAYEAVGLWTGFHKPETIAVVNGHSIRTRVYLLGCLPLRDPTVGGIEASEITPGVVHVPDGAVGGHSKSPWPGNQHGVADIHAVALSWGPRSRAY
jgi:hypothetical protein